MRRILIVKKVIILFVCLFLTLSFCNANTDLTTSSTKILPIDYNEQNYKKYNFQIQKYFNLLPKTNEVSLKNGNTLVVRYKNNENDTKWQYENYPFYWREIATIDLKNEDYTKIRTGKTGFAGNKNKLSVVEYNKAGSIKGFVQTKIIKNTTSKTTIVGYEYILNELIVDNAKWHSSTLKHIIFIEIDKKNNKLAQFIYNSDNNIQYYQINDVIYSNKHDNNIIIDIDDLKFDTDDNFLITSAKTVKKFANTIFAMFLWMIKGDN